jgi:hypothetical protein
MALTFVLVTVAAAFGGHWDTRLHPGGRYVAMFVFLILEVSLLFPSHWWSASGQPRGREQHRQIVCAGNLHGIAVGPCVTCPQNPQAGSYDNLLV